MITVNVESEFDSNRLKRSIAHLETAVRADDKNTRYRKVLSEAYLAARRFDEAFETLQTVWRDRPEPRVAYLIAYAAYRLNRLDVASEYIDQASFGDNVGFSRMHELKGRIFSARGDFADAVNEFSKAMILNPEALLPQWNMARALVRYGSETHDDCTPIFRRALSLLKDLEIPVAWKDEWHENLGRIYLALHHPVEALRHLERSQQPATAEKSMLLGFAYLLRGHHENAASFLREAALNRDIRPRLLSYLEEVAMTPRHLLSKMGVKTGQSAIPLFLDHEYLGEIFGPGAEEIGLLIQAGSNPRSDLMDRTQAEVNPDSRHFGRLLAPGEVPDDKITSPGAAAETLEQPTESATGGDNREATAQTRGDKLFPKTLLEVRDASTEIEESPATPDQQPGKPVGTLSDDDWDIGLDEAFDFDQDEEDIPRTEQFEKPDLDADKREDDK